MIIHTCKQGSREWLKLRMGRPTSSNFDRIVTPGGKLSSSRDGYLRELASELMTGRPHQGPVTASMALGSFLEEEARRYYKLQHGGVVQQVGFCTADDGSYGASTDGLVDNDGVLEIKAPKPETHLQYLLWHKHADKYKPQCQGGLLVTGRQWLDIVSYCPDAERPGAQMALVRVVRDEAYIKLLAEQLFLFANDLNLVKLDMAERDFLALGAPPPKEFLTDADLDAIVAMRREQGGFNAEV